MQHLIQMLKRRQLLPFPGCGRTKTKSQSRRSHFRATLLVERLEDRKLLTTAPTISDVVDRSTLESTATIAIPFTVGDIETPVASLNVSGISSNTTLVPNANIVFGGSGANRTVTITPAIGLSGTVTISLTVTDGDLFTATDIFVLTVTPVYQLPGETIPDLVMNADGSVSINYQISNSTWASSVTRTNETLFNVPGTGTSSDLRTQPTSGGTNRTLRVRPRPGLYGESNVTLSFTDAGAPGPSTFKVTVNPRAIADNLLGVAGKTSTFEVLRNDTAPQTGTSSTIVSYTQPANGTLIAGAVPGTLRYTPNAGFTGNDLFTYTAQYNLGPAVTNTGYVTVARYMNVDTVHTDLRMDYEGGVWSNEVRADLAFGTPNQGGVSNPTILDFDESLLMVNPASIITLPSTRDTNQFNFLGRGPNEQIWNLPQAQLAGVIWPGVNTESIAIGTFASYTPSGDPRATANARWLRFEMVDYRIPAGAVFSMSQSGTSPTVYWDSIDGVNGPNETTLGNNVSDTFWITENTHAHMNWWFTRPGRYEIDVRSKGFIDQGGGNLVEVTSPINTLHFMVYGIGDPSTIGPLTETAPRLMNDTATTSEDSGPVVINVLANDRSDPDPLEQLMVTSATNGANGSVTISVDGQSVSYTPAPDFFGTDNFAYTVTDEHGGVATATVSVVVSPQANLASIQEAYLFYKGSGYQTSGGVAAAIDPINDGGGPNGKDLLRSGASTQATAIANISNYSRGINGVVFDVNNLAASSLTASDFLFRRPAGVVSGLVNPSTWTGVVPVPTDIHVSVLSGTASRIQIEWTDKAIENTWLQVILKANANTGLSMPVVYYIGHAAGEINGASPYRVGATELSTVQTGVSSTLVPLTDARDIDMSRRVGATDLSYVQARISSTILLNNITIPIAGSTEEGATQPPPFAEMLSEDSVPRLGVFEDDFFAVLGKKKFGWQRF